MIAVAIRAARLFAAHWPALLAWYLGGALANYVVIEVAGFVGAFTSVGGLLLMPLAILAPLVSYVAMFLVLRDGMPRLEELAPRAPDVRERRRQFVRALLGGILPFFAFYAAWGFLRGDMQDYTARALEVRTGEFLAHTDVVFGAAGTVDRLGFDAVTIPIIVVAFAGRWAYKRWNARMPRWSSPVAVYLEAVWVFLTVYLISDGLGQVTAWVQSRQAMVWLADLRAGLTGALAPVGFVWDGVEWLLGEAGGILLLPIAWLTIAGVLYGQAVAASAPKLAGRIPEKVRTRYGAIPARARRRLDDVGGSLVGRFRPIGAALVLMWRAGPALIGGYVLLFTAVVALEPLVGLGITRLVGPHDLVSEWMVFDQLLVLAVGLIVEPVRVALVAGAYERTLVGLTPRSVQLEAQQPAVGADGEVEDEGARIVGDDEEGRQREGAPVGL
ncbi:MAG: hypothetical protein PGN24_02725 [Microbacterium arborescens]